MKIFVLLGGLILSYLEHIIPGLLLIGFIFTCPYITSTVLTSLNRLKKSKNKEVNVSNQF